ncbi:filamentation induced by cAMP protein Fic [Modestobacter caceresii]|uniref:Filamentation induced by cAMP protein Fic n=1 Tax=Modestobacter caceresii TaxID=1522368 RepID=A0A098Y3Q7_9ACTN|nr:Fic family protein [Modestobacter caceresii]KGH45518.1 filamentation induced by cAMP protein Fic [Modestobacter caceresii]
MARWLDAEWEHSDLSMVPRADRQFGSYRQYAPDLVTTRPLGMSRGTTQRATVAERAVRELGRGPGAQGLEGLSRFLLRSEAIASSLIEGIAPSPQQVALAELAQEEDVRGFSDQARLVANNITVLRRAGDDLASAEEIAVADIEALHRALLPEEKHHGLRRVQNWVGGSNWHPLSADYVPPPPELVPELMADLVEYMNGSVHAPLVQAGIVHAQFETIHPFTDGNGRVGRALIHTVLTRRGLTPSAILPVSLVLATLRRGYVDGLTAYRYSTSPDSPEAASAVAAWLDVFLDATTVAAEQARTFAGQVAELQREWEAKLADHRTAHGLREIPRTDSATYKLLRALPEIPILTARTAQRRLGVSFPPARAALEELAEAGILARRSVERGTTGYTATDVFSLVTHAERQLASTRWDTRITGPNRPVPAPPEG